ncbi:MAG: M24 family metallopeptidase [Candidatus Margulisiibacteriota bacterium]
MSQAQLKAIRIVDHIWAGLKVSAGQSEKEIAAQIKAKLKEFGSRPAFRIIIASGRRSAQPHGFATDKKIRKGELVVIDFGAVYNGYCTDITRTITARKSTEKQRKILKIVKEAQRRAIKKVRAGVRCCEVDRAAREYIQKKGFGKYFIHSTGHGIGQKVHEAPKISKRNRRRLRDGMVITIEPGIYIKGWGGVRIEDMVLVTKRGCKVLTKAEK